MTINFAQAAATYAQAATKATNGGAVVDTKPAATSFSDALAETLGTAVKSIDESERASLRGIMGEADLTDVVAAVNNAEVTLKVVMAVRDRVIQAYQDIIRMPL